MKAWLRLMAVALLAAGPSACLRNVESVDLSDAAIKARIETTLSSQPGLDLRYLSVDVDAGIATLSGMLKNRREEDLVTHIARRIKGVDQVIVNIAIPD